MIRVIKACARALVALFRAYDSLGNPCSKGHTQHREWKDCPICLIDSNQPVRVANTKGPANISFRIRDQKKHFRTVSLSSGRYQIGQDALADLVLTPFHQRYPSPDRFELIVDGHNVRLVALGKQDFAVGGKSYRQSSLYDRDRIDLLAAQMQLVILREEAHA